ncbi:MAG: SAM-dependent chlorinase/fluorinase [Anaerolineales bacterium]|nr:SAM-dependent chlorinase/fluorinase [Anaerolineales bacterium]
MSPSLIASVTDFGHDDPFVGILKGVVLGISPSARWIDLTHAVPPGDIRQAALAIWQSAAYLPAGSILLAVVDPGVGAGRRAIALAWDHLLAVGPDNGLFSYLATARPPRQVIEILPDRIDPPQPVSRTFHGRDVFAVAAARLAAGWPIERLGEPVSSIVPLASPRLESDSAHRTLTGEVIHVDHFGNALTSIGALQAAGERLQLEPWLAQLPPASYPAPGLYVVWAKTRIPFVATYADVAIGAPLAYIGSSGLLEIGVNRGRADEALGVRLDDRVQLCYKG